MINADAEPTLKQVQGDVVQHDLLTLKQVQGDRRTQKTPVKTGVFVKGNPGARPGINLSGC